MLKMTSKSQISVFLVIVLIILGVVIIATQIQNQATKEPSISSLQVTPTLEMQQYVESCLQDVGERAIRYVMLQGGYYYPPDASTSYFDVDVATYWDHGDNLMPGRDEIEQELAFFVEDNIAYCLRDFIDFESQGYVIEASPGLYSFAKESDDYEVQRILRDLAKRESETFMHASSVITGTGVLFTLQSPIIIDKGDGQYSVESFNALVGINLNKPLQIAEYLMISQQEAPDYVPLDALAELAYANDFRFEIVHYDQNQVIVGLFFKQPLKDELVYAYSNRYDWQDLGELNLEGPQT